MISDLCPLCSQKLIKLVSNKFSNRLRMECPENHLYISFYKKFECSITLLLNEYEISFTQATLQGKPEFGIITKHNKLFINEFVTLDFTSTNSLLIQIKTILAFQ